METKTSIVEALEGISGDWAKNFTKSWTKKELRESAISFNKTGDTRLRINLFERFLNARHILYVHIETIGIYQTDFNFERRFSGNFMQEDTRERKVCITGLSIAVLKKEMVRYGCKCTIPRPIWAEKKKILLSEIKKVQIKENTLLVTLR